MESLSNVSVSIPSVLRSARWVWLLFAAVALVPFALPLVDHVVRHVPVDFDNPGLILLCGSVLAGCGAGALLGDRASMRPAGLDQAIALLVVGIGVCYATAGGVSFV